MKKNEPPSWAFPDWAPNWLRRLSTKTLDTGWTLFGPFLALMLITIEVFLLLLLAVLVSHL